MKKKYPISLIPEKAKYYFLCALSLFFLSMASRLYAQEPNFAWAKRIGTPTQLASGPTAAVDIQGNSYVAGLFQGASLNLDGIILQSANTTETGRCGYIAKYDPQGQILWAKVTVGIITVSGIASSPNTDKLLIDVQGNLYLAGEYRIEQLDQQCRIDNTILSITEPNQYKHLFLAKFDPSGSVLWTRTAQGTDYPFSNAPCNDIHFDLEGNINVTGFFWGSVSFSQENTLEAGEGQKAVFLTKYSADGDILLCTALEGTVALPTSSAYTDTEQVRPDALGNLYRLSDNANEKKLYCYNAQGGLINSQTIDIYFITNGTQHQPSLPGFAVDPQGNIYIGGSFFGYLLLEEESYNGYGNNLDSDAVLIKLTAQDWNVEWVHIPLLSRKDSYNKLLADALGNIYAAGQNDNASENQMLLQKFKSDGTVLWQKIVTGLQAQGQPLGGIHPLSICQPAGGGNIWVSGTFRVNAYFDATAFFTTPSLNHYNGFILQYGSCTTAQPGITVPEVTQMCQGSSIELSASFINPDLDYHWNTGATTETISVDHAGIYYVIAQENDECYAKSQEIWITQLPAPELEVAFSHGIFSAIAEGATYQWINCDTQTPIEGETSASFTPTAPGSYQVAVTNVSGCTTISQCRTVSGEELGMPSFAGHTFVIYPSPAKDILTINSDSTVTSVVVTTVLGQEVLKWEGSQIDVSNLPAGTYLLQATTDLGLWKGKFIKQ